MPRSKIKTISEVEAARRRAITGLRNLGLDEQAVHVEGLSSRQYAEEKGFEIVGCNPMNKRAAMAGKMTRAELEDRVTELETELDDVQEQLGEVEEERDQLQEQVDSIAEIVGGEEEAAEEGETSDSDLEADEPDDD